VFDSDSEEEEKTPLKRRAKKDRDETSRSESKGKRGRTGSMNKAASEEEDSPSKKMKIKILKSAVDDTFHRKRSFHVLQKEDEIYDFSTGKDPSLARVVQILASDSKKSEFRVISRDAEEMQEEEFSDENDAIHRYNELVMHVIKNSASKTPTKPKKK